MNTYWKVSPGFNQLNNCIIVPSSWWWSQLAPWTSASTPALPQTHSPASSLRRMWGERWTFSCSSPTSWWQWSPLLTPPSSSQLSTGRCRARCWPGACVPAWPPTPPSRGQASSPTCPPSGPAWPGWCPPASTRRGWMQVGVFTWDHLGLHFVPPQEWCCSLASTASLCLLTRLSTSRSPGCRQSASSQISPIWRLTASILVRNCTQKVTKTKSWPRIHI